ncbi:YhgE/Pip domain-containing protein [Kurthia sibirica]|uniref:ABC-2 type transporter transmembrane domain-containing protein n=1 Tax=Kurthia sibirica TaxID=202750 RepID=A0A2U3AMV5_9BACL|nr:ABC transporter permease [Kurthia sibirica]PWI25868.1 hypothetical protein DEX24_06610 [Kurthia sibirica]GEK34308.1 phage infection protein [Kurthia sibirica]
MQKKFLALPFIAVIVLGLIFLSTQIPAVKMSPKNLPTAIVSEDAGEMGQTLVTNLQKQLAKSGVDTLEFKQYQSVSAMKKAMTDKDVYGGIVIPKDFSQQFATLQTPKPTQPIIKTYVNQGANTTVATMMTSALDGIVKQLNAVMSVEILNKMTAAKMTVQPAQVALLQTPIKNEAIIINEVGKLGTAPTAFFQPLWFASILGAVLFYFALTKSIFTSTAQQRKFTLATTAIAIVYALFAGYFITWSTTWMLGYSFESFNTVALFSSLACLAFLFTILATLSWLGMPAMAIFILLMFFGLPLIQLAPEMLPDFYAHYILPWLPMKFLIDGLKDILFFGQDLFNKNAIVLIWLTIIAFIVFILKQLTHKQA